MLPLRDIVFYIASHYAGDQSITTVALSASLLAVMVTLLFNCAQAKPPQNVQAPPPPNEASAAGSGPTPTPNAAAPAAAPPAAAPAAGAQKPA
uniref:Uncharacterized protein n=1 Tax=Trichuris muris TaxID=70415 RepID=A0A5S6QC71_TRIMR